MGIGSSLKRSFGQIASSLGPVGEALGNVSFLGIGESSIDAFNRSRQTAGQPPATQEQLTTANIFKNLSREQQKDILINNPNIVTSQGKQFFDPSTNTIRLEESEFQTGQRGRQEQLASELSGQLLGQDLPGTDPSSRFESGRELLAPQFQEDRERLEQQLADQGIPRGTEAHQKELDRLERSQGSQLSALSRESVQTSEAQRAARFNEISSLLGQQQVGGVGFGGFQAQSSGLDLFGAEQQGLNRQFQAQQAAKDRSSAQRAALLGSLGTVGGAALEFSDERLKENIERIGESETGIPIYHFDYINKDLGQFRYEGVMAQDLKESNPEAVITLDDGVMKVDYSKIDVEFRRVN